MQKKKVVLDELMLLRISGAELIDVESLVSLNISVGDKIIRRVYSAEGGDVLVQLRNTDPEKPEETISLLTKKFGADKVIEVCSKIPARS